MQEQMDILELRVAAECKEGNVYLYLISSFIIVITEFDLYLQRRSYYELAVSATIC